MLLLFLSAPVVAYAPGMSGRRAERAKQDRLPADGLPEPRNRHRERIGPDHHESLFRVVPPRNRPVGEGSRILARFTPSVRSVAHPYCSPASGGDDRKSVV